MADAFIKLYKKMLKWEWYYDTNTFRLFMHCLLKANWQDGSWRGVEYEAGQFITSLSKLSQETGLSVHQIRGSLERLKTSGELAIKTTNKYRVITVNNWNKYQVGGKQTDKQTANKPATDKEYKEYKEIKEVKNIYGEYKNVKLTEKEHDKLIADYGESETEEAIKYLDEYIEMKGYKAKSHYLCIRKWVFDAVKKNNQNKPQSLAEKWGLA